MGGGACQKHQLKHFFLWGRDFTDPFSSVLDSIIWTLQFPGG